MLEDISDQESSNSSYYDEDEEGGRAESVAVQMYDRNYAEQQHKKVRIRKDKLKFTASTDPTKIGLMQFLLDETITTPVFLPMNSEDAVLTKEIVQAMIMNP